MSAEDNLQILVETTCSSIEIDIIQNQVRENVKTSKIPLVAGIHYQLIHSSVAQQSIELWLFDERSNVCCCCCCCCRDGVLLDDLASLSFESDFDQTRFR